MLYFFVMLTSVASATANSENLNGRWNLVGVECKIGPVSGVGIGMKKAIESHETEDFYVVAEKKVEHHIIEHQKAKSTQAYCETIYSGPWNIHDGIIQKSNLAFISRKGVGGYECYHLHDVPKFETADRDWPFEIKDDLLKITHKELAIKIEPSGKIVHECESKSDMLMIYKRL